MVATPPNYLSGSKTPGGKYSAWDTYGQGKPDFGKDKGPGDPYHVVQKTIAKTPTKQPKWGSIVAKNSAIKATTDARMNAIRRRLAVIK